MSIKKIDMDQHTHSMLKGFCKSRDLTMKDFVTDAVEREMKRVIAKEEIAPLRPRKKKLQELDDTPTNSSIEEPPFWERNKS